MSKKSHKKLSNPSHVREVAAKTAKAKAAQPSKAVAKPSRETVVASQPAPTKPLKSSATAPARVPKGRADVNANVHVNAKAEQTTLNSAAATSVGPAEGGKAPDFSLPRDGGGSVSLQDFHGKKLVLFFYPKADTPGCTREAIAFTALSDEFGRSGTAVVGISADTVKAQEKFRDKHKLSVPLISDPTHEMLEAYGVWGEKSLYGRKFMGIVRTTVLVGPDGRIARLWRNVKVDGHADVVLAAARDL